MKLRFHPIFAVFLFLSFSAKASTTADFTWNSPNGGSDQYRLYTPTISSGQSVPLILFLAGQGEINNFSLMYSKYLSGLITNTSSGDHAAYVITPKITGYYENDPNKVFQTDDRNWTFTNSTVNFPSGSVTYGSNSIGLFDDTPGKLYPNEAEAPALRRSIEIVNSYISNAATYHIDPSRIFIIGLSVGGIGTLDAVARYPNMFAKAVPLSPAVFSGNIAIYQNSQTGIWAYHGNNDSTINKVGTATLMGALGATANSFDINAKYNYSTVNTGHTGWANFFNDETAYTGGKFYDWLFAAPVPEPSTVAMLLIGLGMMGGGLLRRKISRRNL